MKNTPFATIPIRCASCGQQTHKTLDAIRQSGGLMCECGSFTQLDVEAFCQEIAKSEATIKDYGVKG